MDLNQTPRGERVHIALFGRRNAGKSSVINAVTGQELAVVSEVKGTTTDPVFKSMELLPLGPVVMIDTPGLDDGGALGRLRVEKARAVLAKADIALVVCDITAGFSSFEESLLEEIRARKLPCLVVLNQADRYDAPAREEAARLQQRIGVPVLAVSAKTGAGIGELKERIAALAPEEEERKLLGDLLRPGDVVVLVVPVDKAAPKGRLILPQQQAIRDILDAGAVAVVSQDDRLAEVLQTLSRPPRMVVTDSQVFAGVAAVTPESIPLTSFSILMARYKGDLPRLMEGVRAVSALREDDLVLIAEGCTHHRQCGDIGTVKIPRWLERRLGHPVRFETASGTGFPADLGRYRLVIHCGGCMLNRREMLSRMDRAAAQGVPVVNYGVLIAYLNGILPRCLGPFPEALAALGELAGTDS